MMVLRQNSMRTGGLDEEPEEEGSADVVLITLLTGTY